MHKFRDNAVTGDISLISLVLTSMVCPAVCVLAPLCWASIGTGGGGGAALPQASMPPENKSMDKFSGLGITSAFCSVLLSFVSLMRIYTAFLFSRFPQMYKISAIYSVDAGQETRET